MKYTFILFLCILLFSPSCYAADSDNDIDNLKNQIEQQNAIIATQRKTALEFLKLLKLNEAVILPSMQILERLDDLDRDVYKGDFVQRARDNKATTEDIFSAYHMLIERIESDLQGI